MAPPQPPVTSRVQTVEQVFANGPFVPASVQRDYQWRTSHCLTLLNDIDRTFLVSSFAPEATAPMDVEADPDAISSGTPQPVLARKHSALNHYMLGAIVICKDGKQLAIYDGLQRLTTLTILVCVLRDLTADTELARRLDGLVHMNGGGVRIGLDGRDATMSAQIQPRGESIRRRRAATRTDMGLRIRFAAQAFREKLKAWTAERRDGFALFLMEHVYLDVQLAADARLARQIFVTSNTRGRSLDAIDLLKGQLSDIAGDEIGASKVVQHWNALRASLGDRLPDFLQCIDFIERCEPQGSDCLHELADHLAETRGPNGIEGFVSGLAQRGGDYLALLDVMAKPPTDSLSADIWRLQFFRWPQWRGLALFWYADYRRAVATGGRGAASRIEAAKRRFAALHRRCMGLVLAGFSASDRETILGRALSQAKSGGNPLGTTGALAFKDVQLARVHDALRLPLTDIEVRSTLVRWLESTKHGDMPPAYIRDCTVEHVLPRRPAANSDWITSFESLDARFLACHTLGNLVALDKARNEKLRNAQFPEKVPIFRAAAKEFKLLSDIDLASDWTAQTIQLRTKQLADYATAQLDLPRAAI